jgi:uncharacterized protein (TIGR02996 family)
MDDGPALLAAILAHPDEDTPRLVYADWLQEHGDAERAEFIRLQCELARDDAEDEANGRMGTNPLRRRAVELLMSGRNAVAWRGDLVRLLPRGESLFRRGFVGSVTCGGDDWVRHADAILAAHPVRQVRLATAPDLPYTTRSARRPDGEPVYHFRVAGKVVKIRLSEVAAEELVLAVLSKRWPGITFHFGLRTVSPPDAAAETYRVVARGLVLSPALPGLPPA